MAKTIPISNAANICTTLQLFELLPFEKKKNNKNKNRTNNYLDGVDTRHPADTFLLQNCKIALHFEIVFIAISNTHSMMNQMNMCHTRHNLRFNADTHTYTDTLSTLYIYVGIGYMSA